MGRKNILGGSVGVSQYLRIYRSGIKSYGAIGGPIGKRARPTPWACLVALPSPLLSSGLLPKLLGSLLSRKKSPKCFVAFRLHLVLIFWKTKNKQKTTTGTRHWVSRLVPKNDIK